MNYFLFFIFISIPYLYNKWLLIQLPSLTIVDGDDVLEDSGAGAGDLLANVSDDPGEMGVERFGLVTERFELDRGFMTGGFKIAV